MVVKYLPRILDKDLEKYLTMIGAILIVGPKWCGKTTTAEQHAKSVLKLQDKDNYKTNMIWADIEPSRLLKGTFIVSQFYPTVHQQVQIYLKKYLH